MTSPVDVLDDAKFEEIVTNHSNFVYNVAYRMMGNPDDASEVVQDIFLSAYRARDRFRGDAQVTTWLYRIATNAALMRLRKNSRKKEISTDPKISTRSWIGPIGPMRPIARRSTTNCHRRFVKASNSSPKT